VTQGLVIAPDGLPVVADTTVGVKKWNGTTWDTIGASGASASRVIYGPDGTLYAGGSFTTIGGISAASIAKYNGVAWTPLGSGLAVSAGSPTADALLILPDGTLLVGGFFDIAGGIATVDNIARWNGSAWVFLDVDIGWTTINATAMKVDGTLAIGGGGATSTGVAAANTTITNVGTARTYPTLTITSPSARAGSANCEPQPAEQSVRPPTRARRPSSCSSVPELHQRFFGISLADLARIKRRRFSYSWRDSIVSFP
jgi:hypothetical protein